MEHTNSQGTNGEVVADTTIATETTAVPVVETTPVTSEPTPGTQITPTPLYKNKQLLGAFLIALVILGGASYYVYTNHYKNGGVVAVVNGQKIYQDEFNESVTIIEQAATAQQVDITQELAKQEIKKQALDVLVNNALLIGGAQKAGFSATDEVIQEKYDELTASVGSKEELESRMVAIGLTEAKLRRNIAERIVADQYIESETPIEEITVTGEEVDALLASLNIEGAQLPPLEELRPQAEAEIKSRKQQKIVEDLITTLKTDASIEVKI